MREMNHLSGNETLRELVIRFPYTVDLLNRYRLDYAFSGGKTLTEAIRERGENFEKVSDDLNLAIDEFMISQPDVIYWENEPIGKIIDHIESKHHRFVEGILEDISALLERMNLPVEIRDLEGIFLSLKEKILIHQVQEENELFPLLRDYSETRTPELRQKCLAIMKRPRREHDEAQPVIKQINQMTNDLTPPENSSRDLRNLYQKLDALEKDILLHIHMENSLLFKMI